MVANAFEPGARVKWLSQSGGYLKEKFGTVLCSVPPGMILRDVLVKLADSVEEEPDEFLKNFILRTDCIDSSRKEWSYVVEIKNGKYKSLLYWPHASKLILQSSQELATVST